MRARRTAQGTPAPSGSRAWAAVDVTLAAILMATLSFAGFLAAGAAIMTGVDGPECAPTNSCGALEAGIWTILAGVALAFLVSIVGMIWATRRNQLVWPWPLSGWFILAAAFPAGMSLLDKDIHPYSHPQIPGWLSTPSS